MTQMATLLYMLTLLKKKVEELEELKNSQFYKETIEYLEK